MGAILNRGLIWGQLLANLDVARTALQAARGAGFVLDEGERLRLDEAVDMAAGLMQRAWEAQQRAARRKTTKRKPRTKGAR